PRWRLAPGWKGVACNSGRRCCTCRRRRSSGRAWHLASITGSPTAATILLRRGLPVTGATAAACAPGVSPKPASPTLFFATSDRDRDRAALLLRFLPDRIRRDDHPSR